MQPLATFGLAATLLTVTAVPATADESIDVTPSKVTPGESVTLQSICEGPATRLEYTSDAFSGTAYAELDNTFGTVTVLIEQDIEPEYYEITGRCTGGSSTEEVDGTLQVVPGDTTPTPSGAPQTGGGGTQQEPTVPALAVAGVLLGVVALATTLYRWFNRRAS